MSDTDNRILSDVEQVASLQHSSVDAMVRRREQDDADLLNGTRQPRTVSEVVHLEGLRKRQRDTAARAATTDPNDKTTARVVKAVERDPNIPDNFVPSKVMNAIRDEKPEPMRTTDALKRPDLTETVQRVVRQSAAVNQGTDSLLEDEIGVIMRMNRTAAKEQAPAADPTKAKSAESVVRIRIFGVKPDNN